jgi:ubiquinone/menaquinone biosynthesis C-methylase UbiE
MSYLNGQVFEDYSSHNLQRLLGTKPEKESSKAVVEIIEPMMDKGSTILEVGCSSGHLLRTLGKKDKNIKYIGVDIDQYAISKGNVELGRIKLAGIESAQLIEAEVTKLPFDSNSFEIVVSLNVLEHLNEPSRAIRELLRCAKNYLVIRTLVSDQTFIVKEVRNSGHADLGYTHLDLPMPENELNEFGEPKVFIYQNVYSKALLSHILKSEKSIKKWEIIEDVMYDQSAFDLDNSMSNLPRATKVINGKQVRGLFIDTNYWIVIEKA